MNLADQQQRGERGAGLGWCLIPAHPGGTKGKTSGLPTVRLARLEGVQVEEVAELTSEEGDLGHSIVAGKDHPLSYSFPP